mgnify:CR=1 FL=1
MIIDIVLPAAILLMSFLLKLSLDRTITRPTAMNALYELPVDTIFLSTSLIAAATIKAAKEKQVEFLVLFILYIVASIVITIIWRKTVSANDRGEKFYVGLLMIINYIICISLCVKAINFL